MGFLGVILMIQGFGGLVARQFFDSDFGLLDNWFTGGALTAVQVAVGLAGLVCLLVSVRRSDES